MPTHKSGKGGKYTIRAFPKNLSQELKGMFGRHTLIGAEVELVLRRATAKSIAGKLNTPAEKEALVRELLRELRRGESFARELRSIVASIDVDKATDTNVVRKVLESIDEKPPRKK